MLRDVSPCGNLNLGAHVAVQDDGRHVRVLATAAFVYAGHAKADDIALSPASLKSSEAYQKLFNDVVLKLENEESKII